jgi:excinuclease ABC subunit C
MIDPGRLKKILAHLPRKPGVYLMSDATGQIIYVGKSRLLKNRVRSYFSGKAQDTKTGILVQVVADLQFIVTGNEIEALVLENNLIKKHKPRFNVRLKDSRTHPYLVVTLSEPFPRLLKVRKVLFDDGNRYFGPFPDESGLRFIIDLLSRLFKLCRCKTPVQPDGKKHRACLRYHLKQCPGPCIGSVSPEEYRESVQGVIDFLGRGHSPDLEPFRREMERFSAEFRFEEAAEMRDTIQACQTFFSAQAVELVLPIDRDIWGIAHSPDLLTASIFFIRAGKLLGNRILEIEPEPGVSLEELVGKLMFRFYDQNLIPHRILAGVRPQPREVLEQHFSRLSSRRVRLFGNSRGEVKKLLDMANENAREVLRNLKSRDDERIAEAVLDLERRLGLPASPRRIECVDISHLQGQDPVASLVVSVNAEPRRSEYRRFHIKTAASADDPGAIAEITRRRFQRLLEEGGRLPDLFLVDGGIAQANAARRELDLLGVACPVWGLAKREELLVPAGGEPRKLPLTCPGMRMVIKLRNEAHRFANQFQKKTHTRRVMRSSLSHLPGVGPKTIQKVLVVFGNLDVVAAADPQEVAQKAGIPLGVAELIVNSCRKSPPPPPPPANGKAPADSE